MNLGLDKAQGCPIRSFILSTNLGKFQSIIHDVVKIPIKLIVLGTGLPRAELKDAIFSRVLKHAKPVQLFHELGIFDTWPKLLSSHVHFRITLRVSPTITDLGLSSGTVSRRPPFQPSEPHWRQISLLRILYGILPDE